MKRFEFGGLSAVVAGGTDREGAGDGPVLVLLHGFGAPGEDLVSLWRVIDAPPGTRFVFPAAPLALGGPFGDGRAWWMVDVSRFQRAAMSGKVDDMIRETPDGLHEVRKMAVAMLDDIEKKLGVTRDKIVLGGFSQGSMLALDVALHAEVPPAALVLMSSTLIAADEWRPLFASKKSIPIFQSHGKDDPILPFEVAEQLRDELEAAGFAVTFIPFRGGHGIPNEVIDGLGPFLRNALK
ncbi:MAG: dienelactone hydrolase family protein [Polyangiaceae bacterium]